MQPFKAAAKVNLQCNSTGEGEGHIAISVICAQSFQQKQGKVKRKVRVIVMAPAGEGMSKNKLLDISLALSKCGSPKMVANSANRSAHMDVTLVHIIQGVENFFAAELGSRKTKDCKSTPEVPHSELAKMVCSPQKGLTLPRRPPLLLQALTS